MPIGLARSCPAMSGAEHEWAQESAGSWPGRRRNHADGAGDLAGLVGENVANRFSVTMTSNWLGSRTICMEQLSTYICRTSTSGYSSAMRLTIFPPQLGGVQHVGLIHGAKALGALHAVSNPPGQCAQSHAGNRPSVGSGFLAVFGEGLVFAEIGAAISSRTQSQCLFPRYRCAGAGLLELGISLDGRRLA